MRLLRKILWQELLLGRHPMGPDRTPAVKRRDIPSTMVGRLACTGVLINVSIGKKQKQSPRHDVSHVGPRRGKSLSFTAGLAAPP